MPGSLRTTDPKEQYATDATINSALVLKSATSADEVEHEELHARNAHAVCIVGMLADLFTEVEATECHFRSRLFYLQSDI